MEKDETVRYEIQVNKGREALSDHGGAAYIRMDMCTRKMVLMEESGIMRDGRYDHGDYLIMRHNWTRNVPSRK